MTEKTYSPEVLESIQTAREIASDDMVNIEAGAAYLHDRHPNEFRSLQDASAAIRGEQPIPQQG